MKLNFSGWKLGGKLIFISTCLAVLSLFLKWVDLGFVSVSGFQQGGYLLLILFLYPVVSLLRGKPLNRIAGIVSSSLAVIFSIYFMLSKSVELFGSTVNVAGTGLYLFIISSLLLLAGVLLHKENVPVHVGPSSL